MTASYANPSGILIPDTGNGNVVHAVISNINKEADKDGNKDAEVRVKVRLAHNGLCSLVSAELVEEKEYTVEVPVEEEKKDEKKDEKKEEKKPEDPATPPPAPAAQPEGEEVKKDGDGDTIMKDAVPEKPKTITQTKVKTVYTNIPMECKYVQLSDADVKKFKELEEVMYKEDMRAVEAANAKNALETAIYTFRDKLDETWGTFASADEKRNISALLDETSNWVDDDGSDETKEEYDSRLAKIHALTNVVSKRIKDKEDAEKAAAEAAAKAAADAAAKVEADKAAAEAAAKAAEEAAKGEAAKTDAPAN
eukprot:TRINITY_DN3256_c0_g2_i2.p2 TRINITY_DN3256_c0_g2~~TRINITY_DN3256_c0_g2_i2.p2  ORF type:complete len:309 (-),score=127.81 TRINITY_DN3256_c0_g2_i2:55-981(-)